MEFKEITNFKKSTNSLKIITLSSIIALFTMTGVMYWMNYENSKRFEEKLALHQNTKFVLNPTSGRILTGEFRIHTPDDRRQMYRGLVSEFYECFYDFDGHSIWDNIDAGVNLCNGKVGEVIVSTYFNSQKDLEKEMLQEDTRWYIDVDSVKLDIDNPLHGFAYAKRAIKKPHGFLEHTIDVEFFLEDIDEITDRNPYAAIVTKWTVISQKKLFDKNKK